MHMKSSLKVILVSALVVLAQACTANTPTPAANPTAQSSAATITIGALLPLTGSLASYGETSNAALADAVASINEGGATKIALVIEDTKTDPNTTLDKLKVLKDKGVKLVIGPYARSEVRAVKEYADQNGIVLLSPLSTARSLAVANDNVFRFTPDDEQEGVAVAALAWADGVRVLVPITRDDDGNRGLQDAVKVSFEKLGGKVVSGITYPTTRTDFKDDVRTLSGLITAASAAGQKTGVYLTAFDEVTGVFAAAGAEPTLSTNAKWYGSDSVALSKGLTADKTAASFAVAVGYPNPILGLSEGDKAMWGPISDRLSKKLGRTPDAFALASYDALQVAYKALTNAGATTDVARLRLEITTVANAYTGSTGSTRLNASGDRALGNYDFWAVCRSGADYTWVLVATYASSGGKPPEIARPKSC